MADCQCSFIEPLPNRDLHFSFFSIRKRRTDRFTEYMVLVVYRLKDDRAEFRKIKLTIVAEYAFVDAYVDDLADNVAFLRDLDKRTFQRDRQFVNDRRVYRVALCRVETGFLEFLRLFVARYESHIVGRHHIGGVCEADGERTARCNVLCGLVPGTETKLHHVRVVQSAPRRVHSVRGTVLVVGRDDEYRQRIKPRLRSKVLTHNRFSFCFGRILIKIV